jgi:hypothetical protein
VCATGAGDTIYVKEGTYTDASLHRIWTSDDSFVGLASGTDAQHMTTVMGAPGEAIPHLAFQNAINISDNSANSVRNWVAFKNLKVGKATTTTGGDEGGGEIAAEGGNILIENVEIIHAYRHAVAAFRNNNLNNGGSIHHLTIRNSRFHDIGETAFDNGYGVYYEGDNFVMEHTEIYNVNGAALQIFDFDTGRSSHTPKIRYNYFHDITEAPRSTGNPQCFGVALDGNDAEVHHNVLEGSTCDRLYGISSAGQRAKIFNNIILNFFGAPIQFSGATTGNVASNNIMLGNGNSNNISNLNGATISESTNKKTGALTDCTPSTSTYTHKAGSSCIDAGTDIGFTFNGSAPDQGAFETFGFSSGTVNENSLDVTLGMSLNTPVQNLTTDWTALVSAVARTTTAVNTLTLTESVVRVTFNGAVCAGGETWTTTALATAATDSAEIGGSSWADLNQPMTAFSAQAVTNNCGSAPPTPPASGLHIHYKLDESSGMTAADEVADRDGTHTNSPSITTGKTGNALSFPDGTTESYLAIPYGNTLNPSTSSLSVCLGVLPHSTSPSQKIVFSVDNGTNQRFYIGWIGGTWGIGIQASGFTTGSEFPLAAEWTRLCLVANSGTDIATLYVNGVKGTSAQVAKSYTSYSFSSNFKVGVGTFSVNYGGSTADDVKIYAATALTDQEVLDDYDAWNQTSPTPTGTYSQVSHQFQLLRTPATSYGSASGSVNVIVGGAINIVTQVDCTGSDCDPTALRLYYSKNGGTFLPVPDDCTVDGVCFYGNTDADILSGTVECCVSGALTENDGPTNTTASAIPNVDLAEDGSFVRRSVLKFGTSVVASDTFDFKEYHQTGVAMDGYTPSGGARVTIVSPAAGVGF